MTILLFKALTNRLNSYCFCFMGLAIMPSIWGRLAAGLRPFSRKLQWFSVQGVTEENRQARIDAIMPTFIDVVRYWQQQSGVGAEATALIGFSQGSIMSLESVKAQPGLVSRVIAFNGRFATLPTSATTQTTIHLIHGGEDRVIELSHAVAAQEALMREGGDVTLDIVDDLGHAIDDRSMQFALDHLRYTVPKHYFDEALSGGKPDNDDIVEFM